MEISELSALLADRIDPLVRDLLPAAVAEGHEWRVGSVAGEKGRSMAIHRGGARKGVWQDFSSSEMSGDALDLVSHVKFGGDKKRAVAWAKSWLGLDTLDPARLRTVQIQAKQKAKEAEERARKEAESRAKYAKKIFLVATRLLGGSPVDRYLFGRGIELSKLPSVPGSLRYASSLRYPDGSEWPAMVASIVNGDGEFIAAHRTFLQAFSGSSTVRKAPVADAKLTIGSYRGGFIPLSRGASGKKLRDAAHGESVILCEGIEDGLSLMLCCPDKRVLAAISVSNFQNIRLPLSITDVILAADNDPETVTDEKGQVKPHPSRVALQNAIDAFIDQGRTVRVARPPSGKDFNEYMQSLSCSKAAVL